MRNFFILFLILGSTILAEAQIVNIEDKRTERRDTINWYGGVNLGVNLVDNGNAVVSLNGALNLEYVNRRHWLLSLSKYNLIQVEKKDVINDGFQHLRYNYSINDWLTYEAFTQIQYNENLNLTFRWLLGSGPRFRLTGKNKQRAFLGFAYMYEINEESDPKSTFNDHRLSTYLSFAFTIGENLKIASTSYYQPVFNDFNDLRLTSQSAFIFKITQKLLFTTNFNITYDSRVPEEVQNTIYSLSNGLRWDF